MSHRNVPAKVAVRCPWIAKCTTKSLIRLEADDQFVMRYDYKIPFGAHSQSRVIG
jgi:hypothetical protein